jgi:hypothetical protein
MDDSPHGGYPPISGEIAELKPKTQGFHLQPPFVLQVFTFTTSIWFNFVINPNFAKRVMIGFSFDYQ